LDAGRRGERVRKKTIKPVRLLGEDLTLYKDLSGTFGWSTATARTAAPIPPTGT